MAYIYGLVCPESNEIRYVGVTERSLTVRLRQHISDSIRNKKRYTYKDRWIRRLHANGKSDLIKIEVIEQVSKDTQFDREIYWIAEYRKTHKLTNTSEGGNFNRMIGDRHPCFGKPWSEERKEQLRQKRMGANNPNHGNRYNKTQEMKDAISKGLLDSDTLKHSRQRDEYRTLQKRLNSHPVLLLDLVGNVIEEFSSCKELATRFGVTYSAAKNAKRFGAIFQKQYRIVDKPVDMG